MTTQIPEQELKDRCIPEFIKWMCELAEGFEIKGNTISYFNEFNCSTINIITSWMLFPLLIHRAVEGFNQQNEYENIWIGHKTVGYIEKYKSKDYPFKNYQPQLLTHSECAMLHCLLDMFEGERK